MPLTKIMSVNMIDAAEDGCTSRLNILATEDPAGFGNDLLTKYQAVTNLNVTGLSTAKETPVTGEAAPVGVGAGHPYSDGRAWLDLVFATANPYIRARLSIPAPKVTVVAGDDFIVPNDAAILADIVAACVGTLRADEGDVATALDSARIVMRKAG